MSVTCDIHVLCLNEPADALAKCIQSVEHPALSVHLLAGISGQIGLARKNGYMLGDAPYVSSCDPDDTYDKDVLLHMIDILNDNPDTGLVYSGENIVEGSRTHYHFNPFDAKAILRTPMACHGVIVFRRNLIESAFPGLVYFKYKYERWFSSLFAHFSGHRIIGVDMPGRTWNRHSGQTSQKISNFDTRLIRRFIASRSLLRML